MKVVHTSTVLLVRCLRSGTRTRTQCLGTHCLSAKRISEERQHLLWRRGTRKEKEKDTEDIWSLAQGKYEPELECGICMTSPALKYQAYGFNNCECVFCLSCIKSWRREKEQRKETTRSCPLCRTLSHYMIPSFETFAISSSSSGGDDALRETILRKLRDAKENALDLYLEAQKKKVCKYFQKDGFCQFGSSCQFKHLRQDGEEAVIPRPRFIMGSEYVSDNSQYGEAQTEECDSTGSRTRTTPGLVVLGDGSNASLADYIEKKGNKMW